MVAEQGRVTQRTVWLNLAGGAETVTFSDDYSDEHF